MEINITNTIYSYFYTRFLFFNNDGSFFPDSPFHHEMGPVEAPIELETCLAWYGSTRGTMQPPWPGPSYCARSLILRLCRNKGGRTGNRLDIVVHDRRGNGNDRGDTRRAARSQVLQIRSASVLPRLFLAVPPCVLLAEFKGVVDQPQVMLLVVCGPNTHWMTFVAPFVQLKPLSRNSVAMAFMSLPLR